MFRGRGCPDKFVIKKKLACLAVDIRLISTASFGVFQLNLNRKGMRTLSCVSEFCNGARKV